MQYSDNFYQTARLVVFIGVSYGMIKAFGTYVGILYGWALYMVLVQVFEKIVQKVINCESIGTFDEVFFLDNPKNNSNATQNARKRC